MRAIGNPVINPHVRGGAGMAPRKEMRVLVINAGSSSLKYQVFVFPPDRASALTVPSSGVCEGIGEPKSKWKWSINGADGSSDEAIADHGVALARVRQKLENYQIKIDACGHRVVHGGDRFSTPTLIDAAVLEYIMALKTIAPLHNPPQANAISKCIEAFGGPQVAVFDTAFHATMPEKAWRYPVSPKVTDPLGIRRYGFHGTSHDFVHKRAAAFLGKPALTCITLHLGNGASLAAIKEGKVVDTSMGLTPLAGVMMGTRSGDIDPSIVSMLASQPGQTPDKVFSMLNKQSGLLGLTGSNDLRVVCAMAEDASRPDAAAAAKLAIDMYAYRVRAFLGSYLVHLGGRVDALIFTAGVGENSSLMRSKVLENLSPLGIAVDEKANKACVGPASARGGADVVRINGDTGPFHTAVLVVNTNEELEIAEQACAVIDRAGDAPVSSKI